MRIVLVLIFALLSLVACTAPPTPILIRVAASTPTSGVTPPSVAASGLFDGQRAYQDVLVQTSFGRRDAGTPGDRATSDYIQSELKKTEWKVEAQDFTYKDTPIRNVIGKTGSGPLIIVGAHFDSRKYADQDKVNPKAPVPAANDGASGAAVLLELTRVLNTSKLKNEVWLAFFDAEDNGDIEGWQWSVGAYYVADHLPSKPAAVVVLDMIGDADQNIYYEQNSDRVIEKQIFDIAAQLGYGQQFVENPRWEMTDDHTPFLQKEIPAVDLIDFDYPYWHTTQDTADKVSAASLERVGRVMQTWLESR